MPAAIVLVVVALACAGCGTSPGPDAGTSGATTVQGPVVAPVKAADSIVRMAAQVEAARAQGRTDLAGLSDGVVHVRPDGAIEILVHATVPVGQEELAELRGQGAEIVTTSATPAVGGQPSTGLVQAWLPPARLGEVSNLAWVGAVTPPAYGSAGG